MIGCLLTDDVAIDGCICQIVEEGRGMVRWMKERGRVEERHWGESDGRPDPGRLDFKSHPCGGGHGARPERCESSHRASHADSCVRCALRHISIQPDPLSDWYGLSWMHPAIADHTYNACDMTISNEYIAMS